MVKRIIKLVVGMFIIICLSLAGISISLDKGTPIISMGQKANAHILLDSGGGSQYVDGSEWAPNSWVWEVHTDYSRLEVRGFFYGKPYFTKIFDIPASVPDTADYILVLGYSDSQGRRYDATISFRYNKSMHVLSSPVLLSQSTQGNEGSYYTDLHISGYDWYYIEISADRKTGASMQHTAYLYLKNNDPSINVTSPIDNNFYSTTLPLSGSVSDADTGDVITVKYAIDGGAAQALPNPITTSGTFNTNINISGLSHGSHTLNVWAEDDKGGISSNLTRTLKVDKVAPTIGAPTVTVSSSSAITVTASASDPATSGVSSGIHAQGYQFARNGTNIGSWQGNTLSNTGLTANTQYRYKVKARDAMLNESAFTSEVSKYTLALDPTAASFTRNNATTVNLAITGNAGNGTLPQYKVDVKLKGAGIGGAAVTTSTWSTTTSRVIGGLQPNIEYEVWVTTMNRDNVANAPVKMISSMYTNHIPQIQITNASADYIKSAIPPNNKIRLTGKVADADGDQVTISAVLGGVAKVVDILSAPGILPGSDNWILEWDGSELSEGTYTGIVITVTDSNGSSATVTYTGTITIDKTAPVANAPTINVTSQTEIKVDPDAADPVVSGATSGLDAEAPYMYNINGVDEAEWQAGQLNMTGLTPNTPYTIKYKVRDAVGNESTYSIEVTKYTLAVDAQSCTTSTLSAGSIELAIAPGIENTVLAEYKVEVKLLGAGEAGAAVSVSDWSTDLTRAITGLAADTDYEVWVTVRNGDDVENRPVKLVNSLITNHAPGIALTGGTEDQVKSEVSPYNKVSLSGKVQDLDGNSVEVSAEIDGVVKNVTIDSAPVTAPVEDNWSLEWDGSELSEGMYTGIVITVTDSNGSSATVTYTGTITIDKTAPVEPVLSADIAVPTNNDVTITIANWSDATTKHYRIDGGKWLDYTVPVVIEHNCTVEALGIDEVGNESPIGSITINNIFKASEILFIPSTDSYNLSLEGNLSTGWNYNISVMDKHSGLTVFERMYANDTIEVAIPKEALKNGYEFTVTIKVLDDIGNEIHEDIKTVIKEIERLEFEATDSFLLVGQEKQYKVIAMFKDGSIIHQFEYVDWTSDKDELIVDQYGNVSITSEGAVMIKATGRAPNDSVEVSLAVVTENLANYIFDRSHESKYLYPGDVVQYNITAVCNPTEFTNYANVTWHVSDNAIGTIDSNGKLTLHSDGILKITATDKTLNHFSRSFIITVHKPHTVVENGNGDFVIDLPGDLPTGWNYEVNLLDKINDTITYELTAPGDTVRIIIPESRPIEGHTYEVVVNIVDENQNDVVSKGIPIKKADKTAPTIRRVYVEDSTIKVIAEDNVALEDRPYKFSILATITLTDVQEIITSNDPYELELLLETDRNIGGLNTSWSSSNSIGIVKIGDKFLIEIRDTSGNIAECSVTVDKLSGTIYGELTQEELAQLEEEKRRQEEEARRLAEEEGRRKELEDAIIQTEKERQQEAEKALSTVEPIITDTPVNSQDAELVIDLSSMVSTISTDRSPIAGCIYRLELVEKNTGVMIYSKMLKDTNKIVIPDLDDGVAYNLNISILDIEGKVINAKTFECETPDRTPPVITAIKIENGDFVVEAADNKALAQSPYMYQVISTGMYSASRNSSTIEGMLDAYHIMAAAASGKWKLNTWTTENELEGVPSGTVIKTVVRDDAGNTSEFISTVNHSDETLVTLENKDHPIMLVPGTTGDISTYFNIPGDSGSFTYEVNNDQLATVDDQGIITGLRKGTVIVTARNTVTGETKQLLIKIKNISTAEVRRVIVEKESETNLKYIYKDSLLYVLDELDTLRWTSNNPEVASVSAEGIVTAHKDGIAKIITYKKDNSKGYIIYVVVAEAGSVKSKVQEIDLKVGYVVKKGTTIDTESIYELFDFNDKLITESRYLVFESTAPEIIEIRDNKLYAIEEGLAEVFGVDLINGIVNKIKVRVEDVSPVSKTFVDLDSKWVETEIKNTAVLRIIKGCTDGKFRPDENTKKADFLTMFSRMLLLNEDSMTANDRPKLHYQGLSESKWYYTYSAHVISRISPIFAYTAFGENMDGDDTITRGEVAEIIMSITKGKLPKNSLKYAFKDLNDNEHEEALRYCIEAGIFKGYGNGKVGGNDNLTRAQMLVVFSRVMDKI